VVFLVWVTRAIVDAVRRGAAVRETVAMRRDVAARSLRESEYKDLEFVALRPVFIDRRLIVVF
jgi:hypothetical protein